MVLGSMGILIKLFLLIHEPEIFFHLFVHSTLIWYGMFWHISWSQILSHIIKVLYMMSQKIIVGLGLSFTHKMSHDDYCTCFTEFLHCEFNHEEHSFFSHVSPLSYPWHVHWSFVLCTNIRENAWSFNGNFDCVITFNLFNKFQCFPLKFWVLTLLLICSCYNWRPQIKFWRIHLH